MNFEEINNELNFEPEPDVELHADHIEHKDAREHLALQMLKQVKDSLTHVIHLLEEGDQARATRHMVDLVTSKKNLEKELERSTGSVVLEGVFDGVCMVGSDGVRYDVSENYASKSKLIEGDILKLTIKTDGGYLYKQINPTDRMRMVGKLAIDDVSKNSVVCCGVQVCRVLDSSVKYYKGTPGDEVVVLVPRSGGSTWAAVENIVRS